MVEHIRRLLAGEAVHAPQYDFTQHTRAAETHLVEPRPVLLVERLPEVGGLARCFRYGDFTFDIGPHRFHTYSERALALIREALEKAGVDSSQISYIEAHGTGTKAGDAAEFKEPWDVLPTAHYFMGGVKTEEFCISKRSMRIMTTGTF